MIIESMFQPPWWLANNHVQTIYPTLLRRDHAKIDQYERIELTDGDFIDLAWANGEQRSDAPLIVLLHGLGGSVRSVYVAGLLRSFNQAGYRAVLMHFRGASGEPNRLPRAYHSGDTGDLNDVLQHIHQREPHTKKAVVGISLGGNVLLKWLGEVGEQTLIHCATAVSVPFQLDLVTERINKGLSRIYQAYLLQGLRSVFWNKLDLVSTVIPLTKNDLLSLKTLRAFDERITAPLHGFKNAQAYYQEASSKQYLSAIKTPTLIIHALDDPFMTAQVIPNIHDLSPHTTLELSRRGGHVGFVNGRDPATITSWLEYRVPNFLMHYL